jgi:hypothetical protein
MTYSVDIVGIHAVTALLRCIGNPLRLPRPDLLLAAGAVDVEPVLVPAVHLGVAQAAHTLVVGIVRPSGPTSALGVKQFSVSPGTSVTLSARLGQNVPERFERAGAEVAHDGLPFVGLDLYVGVSRHVDNVDVGVDLNTRIAGEQGRGNSDVVQVVQDSRGEFQRGGTGLDRAVARSRSRRGPGGTSAGSRAGGDGQDGHCAVVSTSLSDGRPCGSSRLDIALWLSALAGFTNKRGHTPLAGAADAVPRRAMAPSRASCREPAILEGNEAGRVEAGSARMSRRRM